MLDLVRAETLGRSETQAFTVRLPVRLPEPDFHAAMPGEVPQGTTVKSS